MGDTEERILQLLADGVINAEEADNLLAAVGPDDDVETVGGDPVLTQEITPAAASPVPPNLARFRAYWRIPFFIALGSMLLSGAGLALMYQSAEGASLLGLLCLWSVFLPALLVMLLAFLTRRAPWLHVRVQEKGGHRIAISLPLPLGISNWIINAARPFVGQNQAQHLETAGTFVRAMKDDPVGQPLIIDVDDEDGDKVQIYIG